MTQHGDFGKSSGYLNTSPYAIPAGPALKRYSRERHRGRTPASFMEQQVLTGPHTSNRPSRFRSADRWHCGIMYTNEPRWSSRIFGVDDALPIEACARIRLGHIALDSRTGRADGDKQNGDTGENISKSKHDFS
jgi:hypothetical protein